MAAKKAKTIKTEEQEQEVLVENKEVVNEQETTVEEIEEKNDIIETIETELHKSIETVSEMIEEEQANQKEFLSNIDVNNDESKEMIEKEINRVDNIIEDLKTKLKNNKVFVKSTNWNGWGYNE